MEAVTDERSESVTHRGTNHVADDAPRPYQAQAPEPTDSSARARRDDDVLAPAKPRLPPAAAADPAPRNGPARPSRPVTSLFILTLLSAVDGSLLALAAAGRLRSLTDAVTIGLVVVAGAGSWLAANQAFAGRRRTHHDWGLLAGLGALTLASTVLSVWLGTQLGAALTLHVLPKGAGLVLLLVGAEVAGLRLPRAGRLPLPLAGLGLVLAAEVLLQWTA